MKPEKPSLPDGLDRLLLIAGFIAGAWMLVLMFVGCVSGGEVRAESGGWPASKGRVSDGITLSQSSAAALAPRQAQPSAVVRIEQSGHATAGVVIQTDHRGTWLLTCKHSRRATDPWTAGQLRGSYTRLDTQADLALLYTRQRWHGAVMPVADKPAALPIRFVHSQHARAVFPWGSPMTELPSVAMPGDSGRPLVVGGRVAGVLSGSSPDGGSLYTEHGAILRFIREGSK